MSLTIEAFMSILTEIGLTKMMDRASVEKACVIVEDEAKRVLGTYDYGWPPLAQTTIDNKDQGDSPGLETGEMRDSVKHEVTSFLNTTEGHIGTDNQKAVWFELGTIQQPPRSWLREAAVRKEDEVVKEIGHEVTLQLQTIYRLRNNPRVD